ncbi:DUF4192 domain-containing protein [Streptomyces sp. NBC_01497]|uniref:DUF4192 domain-containing protein n=1 Tax=Streptomyces sp. NBC_01497 TaxID=2903885 RepID=UPI002E32082C|nr:DUF4192 domain-containing protein [Streptomyces sp. NBC_01497]
MSNHHDTTGPCDEQPITLRGPAELVDALPYLLGFTPTDSVVLVTLHGERARFGGRLRLGIPPATEEWGPVADLLAEYALEAAERRGTRPDGILVFLWQDPDEKDGESGREVMERLRPFAQLLRTACGAHDLPVLEALCVSGGRFWSYCCPDERCCPAQGRETVLPGTSVMAAAAAYAGLRVRGSLREMESRIQPGDGTGPAGQARAFDAAGGTIVPEILGGGRAAVAGRTLSLARDLMRRLDAAQGPAPMTAATEAAADALDDTLLLDEEVAALVLGLQDRETRDRAAAWTDERESGAALRLWRALARRCAGIHVEYAAAPLVLAAWFAWAMGDEPGARVAVSRALTVDPHCRLARLLHEAYNRGLDTSAVRSCFDDMDPHAGDPAGGTRETPVPGGASAPETGTVPSASPRGTRARLPRPPGRKDVRPGTVERPGGGAAKRRARPRGVRRDRTSEG